MANGDRDAEEVVARMTDEELLGLSTAQRPPTPETANVFGKTALGALLGPRPGSGDEESGSRRPSMVDATKNDTNKPGLRHSYSAPAVGALRPCSAAEVKAQRKQSFHFKRQRRWLEIRNKQHCLSFTEQEIADFRKFFVALAKGKETLRLDQFEDMLVCLDLAKSKHHVREYMEAIQHNVVDNQITFEDFLKAFESQLGENPTMDVLKQLLQGTYDSRDLDYPTFISERRRELIINATGARGIAAKGPSAQIVRTFSNLLEDRCYQDFGGRGPSKSDDGVLLMGGLGTMWNVACVQHGLARTLTAEERTANSKKSVPLSPRTVVNNIVKAAGPKTLGVHRMGHTVIIEADRISPSSPRSPSSRA